MKEYQVWAEEVLQKVREKMEWVSEKNQDKIPYTTDANGNYDDRSEEKEWLADDGLNWWTNGFWGGIMWLLYQDTGEERYADIARKSERKLEKCFETYYGLHHDVGFMFLPTAVADYRLTGSLKARRAAMHGANLLAGRFNPAGKFIRAWNEVGESDTRGWAIIDCMFNISLLYWASEESKDPRFRQMAMLHADTVLAHFIRPHGSVCHIVEFDPEKGIVCTAGGLFYYFEKEQVRSLLCAMAERFPGGMIAFDGVNALGLKGVSAEVKLAGNNSTKSFFSLERPKEELESWSPGIVNVVEKDYADGYLKGGYRKTPVTRLFNYIMRTFHMSFMLHAEFAESL